MSLPVNVPQVSAGPAETPHGRFSNPASPSFLTVVRVAYEGCARDELIGPSEVVPRVRELIALAVGTLPGAWSAT